MKTRKRAAHFLLIPELLYSPPNTAIINAYLENNYEVDIFAPGLPNEKTDYGNFVTMYQIDYSWLWICRNLFNIKWFYYSCYSGTSEDPLAIVGIISMLYRKKSFVLVDEIKSDTYRGDRSDKWKSLCIWGIRQSNFQIVNDNHRIALLRSYAKLGNESQVIVYPGSFYELPEKNQIIRDRIRRQWGFIKGEFVIGASGGFNMTSGADWLLKTMKNTQDLFAVIQPLGVSQLALYLLGELEFIDRMFIQNERLSWKDAWLTAQGFDLGLCIYSNPASQFQKMGISSNRLCMFLAMGVPVIASRQESFNFLEDYECGIMVSSYDEFRIAVDTIRSNHQKMKDNCEKCFRDYIEPNNCFQRLKSFIHTLGRQ